MAAATTTADSGVKSNKDGVLRNLWQNCEGETLVACKKAMKHVKGEFFKTLKNKFKIDVKNKEYDTTDDGICLIMCPPDLIGGNYYTGLVKLNYDDQLGGYVWASIRVVNNIGIEKMPPYQVQGFTISVFKKLRFVQNGKYLFDPILTGIINGGLRPINLTKKEEKELKNAESTIGDSKVLSNIYPKNWRPLGNDPLVGGTFATCKQGLEHVKKDFFKMAKERGYNGSDKYYTFNNNGICFITCPPSMNGYNSYIGLVALETFGNLELGLIYTYYASIRFSQAVGIEDVPPFQLEGFIISVMPTLQWVSNGVYRFGSDVKPDDKAISLAVGKDDDNKDNQDNNKQKISFFSGRMDYLPTGSIQTTMDSLKDVIKKQCGITGDLDTFQVVSATACNSILGVS